ncbi:hypothetical protein AYI70_g6232, partial [Smittium culicis]
PASSNAFKGRVTVKYASSNLSLLVNGVSKVDYNVKGMTLSQVFFAPFTGKATISGGLFNCASIDSCPEPSSASSATSVSSESSTCGTTSTVGSFSVTSSPYNKMYNFNSPIVIPCATNDFTFDFDVDTQSDLFVAITGPNGYSASEDLVETYFGFEDDLFLINKGKNNLTASNPASAPASSNAFKGRVTVKYASSNLSLLVNGVSKVDYNVKGMTLSQVFFAPFTGKATISGGLFNCASIDSCPEPSSASSASSASSESSTCGTTSTVGSFSVTSSPYTKMYNFNSPIVIPCATNDFTFDFDVDTQSDLFVAITGPNGYSASEDLVETYFGFEDDLFLINKGKNNLTASNPASAPASSNAFKGRVTVKYASSNLSLLVNGVSKVDYNVKGMTLSQVFFAPFTGKATISGGLFNCASIDSCPEVSSSSSESSCANTSSILDFSITSSPYTKMYDLNDPIAVPCATPDFQFDFDIDAESDMFVAITDCDGFDSDFGFIETYFGFSDDLYLINKGVSTGNSNSTTTITQPDVVAHLTIKYTNGTLSLSDSGVVKVSYKVKNLDLQALFIAPFTGTADISNGIFTCSSIFKC